MKLSSLREELDHRYFSYQIKYARLQTDNVTKGHLLVVSEEEEQLLNHFSGEEKRPNACGGQRNANISQTMTGGKKKKVIY